MNGSNGKPDREITRRQMLVRLGLAAGAIYVAPALLPLSEARASSFSGPSRSGPSHSGPSFSGARRRRRRIHGAERVQPRPRRRRLASSLSFSR